MLSFVDYYKPKWRKKAELNADCIKSYFRLFLVTFSKTSFYAKGHKNFSQGQPLWAFKQLIDSHKVEVNIRPYTLTGQLVPFTYKILHEPCVIAGNAGFQAELILESITSLDPCDIHKEWEAALYKVFV